MRRPQDLLSAHTPVQKGSKLFQLGSNHSSTNIGTSWLESEATWTLLGIYQFFAVVKTESTRRFSGSRHSQREGAS